MSVAIEEHNGRLVLRVRVVPRASVTRVQGVEEGVLVIRVAAPPVDGKANAAVVSLLCDELRLRKSQVEIEAGEKARHKRIALEGTSREQVQALACNANGSRLARGKEK